MNRLFDILKPRPSPFPLKRIGGSQDGAYIVPSDFEGIEACFSPGVNYTKSFEDQLCVDFGIHGHMCDYSCDVDQLKTPLITGLQTFKKKWLATTPNETSICMEDWVSDLCQSRNSDLLLQMDIEGAEYAILQSLDHVLLTRFRILILEFHSLHRAIYEPSVLFQVCLPLFEKLSRDFICVHAHPNNYRPYGHLIPGTKACLHEFVELTFLRRDRFMLVPFQNHHPVHLPHHLDVVNVPENPLLFLEPEWSNGRTFQSSITILRERLLHAFRK